MKIALKPYYLVLLLHLICFYKSYGARVELKSEVVELWLIDSLSSSLVVEDDVSIDEIIERKNQFQLAPKHPHHISNIDKTTWLHYTLIDKRTTNTPFRLEFFDFHIDEITMFWQKQDGSIHKSLAAGYGHLFNNRQINHKNVSFNLDFVDNDTTEIYIRIKSDKENFVSPVIKTYDRFFNYVLVEYMFFGIFYGISIFIILYNLVYFFILKEYHYLYYVIYTVGITIFLMFRNGTGFQYLWPDYPVLNNITDHVALNVGITGLLLFSVGFLKIKQRYPKFTRIIYLIIAIQIATVFVEIFLNSFWLDEIVEILIIQVVFALGIFLRRESGVAFKAYIVAFIILDLSFLITYLESINLIPSNPFTVYAVYIGFFSQYFSLSLSMAERTRSSLKQRNEATDKLLKYREESNRELEKKVEQRTLQINEQKAEILYKNKSIMDSVNYAQTIQNAMLPSIKEIMKSHPEFYVLNLPRDVVSGDFYWFHSFNEAESLLVLADCTGHGVPGALMSMVGVSALQDIISRGIKEPSEVLLQLHRRVMNSLRQEETRNTDGMDASVIFINKAKREVLFSGAKSSLVVSTANETKRVKGDRFSVGGVQHKQEPIFSTQKISYNSESFLRLVMTTDGYTDQFGGESKKKYSLARLIKVVESAQDLSLKELKDKTYFELVDWQGSNAQIDDILMIGIDLR